MTNYSDNVISTTQTAHAPDQLSRNTGVGARIEQLGSTAIRFGLAGLIGWIGAMKFTSYEAEAISGLVQNSPFMSWVYEFISIRGFGVVLGTIELATAALIAAGFAFKRAGVLGAAMAVGMFLTTLSFLFTTPGVAESTLGGFPALSVMPGQFLLKDVVLLAVSVWLLGRSLGALRDA